MAFEGQGAIWYQAGEDVRNPYFGSTMLQVCRPRGKGCEMIDKVIRFCLENKLVVALIIIAVVAWGAMGGPFDWSLGGLPRPVPTDAIPDIGENQQIILHRMDGTLSAQDVDDQITYPLTVSLLGVPGVKTVRSYSFFGFSTIYVIFDEDVRVLLVTHSCPGETQQPAGGHAARGVQPGWVGFDAAGPDFLVYPGRSRSRWQAGWRLGLGRVAHCPGLVRAVQPARGQGDQRSGLGGRIRAGVPDRHRPGRDAGRALRWTRSSWPSKSNIDVGARSIEISKAEYFIRGRGFVENVEDHRIQRGGG